MDNKKISAVCRTCLHTDSLEPIFSSQRNERNFSENAFVATGVKVTPHDGLPQYICKRCLEKIRTNLDFRKQCKNVEIQLFHMISKVENHNDDAGIKKEPINTGVRETTNNNIQTEIERVKIETGLNNIANKAFAKIDTGCDIVDSEVKCEHYHVTENYDDDDDDKPLKYLMNDCNKQENIHNDKTSCNMEVTSSNNLETTSVICEFCNKLVLTKNLHSHLAEHNKDEEKSVVCDLCNNYVKRNYLNRHHELMHQANSNSDKSINSSNGEILFNNEYVKSEICVTKNDSNAVLKHLYEFIDLNRKRVTCKLCQKNLSIRSVDAHITKCHPGADSRRVKCDLCEAAVLAHKLNRHKTLMHGSDSFKCRYCKWGFSHKEALIAHVGGCSGRKKRRVCDSSRELRQCDVCQKTMQKGSLRLHVATKHAGLRPVCEHCGRSFGNQLRLREHRRAKHGYDKLRCPRCDFRSASAAALANHERRHRGEKPYVCESCGAKFHAAYLLAQHRQSHATVKQFQCDACPASFKANNSLHMHRRACHSTSKYACTVCARAYSCRNYAVKHMRTVHRYAEPVPQLLDSTASLV